MNSCKIFKLAAFFIITILPMGCFGIAPIALDSRIKTYIYSPSEVFPVYGNYMYQSYIEFEPKESIKTIAVGDSVSWNVNPAGRRIFVRPFEKHGRTNMIVITNLNTYVFDLISEPDDSNVMYIVKFVKGDKLVPNTNIHSGDIHSGYLDDYESFENEENEIMLFDESIDDMGGDFFNVFDRTFDDKGGKESLFATRSNVKLNRNYSSSGDADIKPLEAFDNTKVTVVRFKSFNEMIKITSLNDKDQEQAVKVVEFKGYLVIKGVHEVLSFTYEDGRRVTVYNNLMV